MATDWDAMIDEYLGADLLAAEYLAEDLAEEEARSEDPIRDLFDPTSGVPADPASGQLQLSEEELASISKPSVPWCTHPLAPIFSKLLETLPAELSTVIGMDVHMQPVADLYFDDCGKLHTSKEVAASICGVPTHRLEPLNNLVVTLVHLHRLGREEVEAALASCDVECVCYLDFTRYDETPMRVTHRQGPPETVQTPVPATSSAEATSSRATPANTVPSWLPGKASTVSKMFSTQNHGCMLVRVPAADDPTAPSTFIALKFQCLTWNQLLERGNACCIHKALTEMNSVTKHSESFKFKARIVSTDAAPANAAAERQVLQDRGTGWAHMQLWCIVHMAHGIRAGRVGGGGTRGGRGAAGRAEVGWGLGGEGGGACWGSQGFAWGVLRGVFWGRAKEALGLVGVSVGVAGSRNPRKISPPKKKTGTEKFRNMEVTVLECRESIERQKGHLLFSGNRGGGQSFFFGPTMFGAGVVRKHTERQARKSKEA